MPPLSLFSHDSLGKRNVLVAPRISTSANRATISGTGRKTRTHTHHVYLLGSSEHFANVLFITLFVPRFAENTCGKQVSKRKNTHYFPSSREKEREKDIFPERRRKCIGEELIERTNTSLFRSLARSYHVDFGSVRTHIHIRVYTTRVRA